MLLLKDILLILLIGVGMGMGLMGGLWMLQDKDNNKKYDGRWDR